MADAEHRAKVDNLFIGCFFAHVTANDIQLL